MHLEGDMTVVENLDGHLSQLGINYVTSISHEDQSQEQIVHYCENVKYETGQIKQEYKIIDHHRLQEGLTTDEQQHVLENNVSIILCNLLKKKLKTLNTKKYEKFIDIKIKIT